MKHLTDHSIDFSLFPKFKERHHRIFQQEVCTTQISLKNNVTKIYKMDQRRASVEAGTNRISLGKSALLCLLGSVFNPHPVISSPIYYLCSASWHSTTYTSIPGGQGYPHFAPLFGSKLHQATLACKIFMCVSFKTTFKIFQRLYNSL